MLLGSRLLGTTFWCGLSNHQAATAQMGTWQAEFSLRIKTYRRVPTPLRSTSPFSEYAHFEPCERNRRTRPRRADRSCLAYKLITSTSHLHDSLHAFCVQPYYAVGRSQVHTTQDHSTSFLTGLHKPFGLWGTLWIKCGPCSEGGRSDLTSADVGCGLAGAFLSPGIDSNSNAKTMRPGVYKLTLLSEPWSKRPVIAQTKPYCVGFVR